MALNSSGLSEKTPPEPSSGTQSEKPASTAGSDVVVITGQTPDGAGLGVVRVREGQAEVGSVRPLEHGKPIHGEVVTLHPRKDLPVVCDVEVDVPAPATLRRGGPPQVATDTYRKNWDVIFAREKAN